MNALFVTDPVYSAGINLQADQWTDLLSYCRKNDLWLIVDMAFSCLSWNGDNAWLEVDRLTRANHPRVIIIDSPAKRLFTNNMKFAFVLAPNEIVEYLVGFMDSFLGNISASQINLAELCYDGSSRSCIESVCRSNSSKFLANFDGMNHVVGNSDKAFLLRPESGFHALLFDSSRKSHSVDVMATCTYWMSNLNLLAVPTHDFRFHPDDNIGLRINLTRDASTVAPFLRHFATNGLTQ
jgi:aspartate/methionine/tyrosine aminotransferase